MPNENPIGQRVGQNLEESGKTEIIGIIRDTKYDSVRDAAPPTMYTPIRPGTRSLTVMVRTAGEPASLTETVRTAMQQVDPDVPMTGITTQSDQVDARFAQERLFALAYSLFGALALLLACIGLFGLMSYSVSRRTNEIGIRMALGAQRAGVVGMVLRESMLMVVDRRRRRPGRRASRGGRFVESVLFGLSTDRRVDDQRRDRRHRARVARRRVSTRAPRRARRSDGGAPLRMTMQYPCSTCYRDDWGQASRRI